MDCPRRHVGKQIARCLFIVQQVADAAGDGPLLGKYQHIPVDIPRGSENKTIKVIRTAKFSSQDLFIWHYTCVSMVQWSEKWKTWFLCVTLSVTKKTKERKAFKAFFCVLNQLICEKPTRSEGHERGYSPAMDEQSSHQSQSQQKLHGGLEQKKAIESWHIWTVIYKSHDVVSVNIVNFYPVSSKQEGGIHSVLW